MAISFERLQELLTNEGIRFFLAPGRPVCLVHGTGAFGSYQLTVSAQDDGGFLQMRTINYLNCPEGHANLPAVLHAVANLDFRLRLVKFGWDPKDGEVMAYADHVVCDGDVTQEQFQRILRLFLAAVDQNYPRLKTAVETGTDPGDAPPGQQPPQPEPPGVERI